MAKTKSTAGNRNPQTKNYTYWVTRNSYPESGQFADKVKVWLAKPDRERNGLGFRWEASAEAYYGEWSIVECLYHVKTYPDDDRQCIRVEGDEVWDPGKAIDRPTSS